MTNISFFCLTLDPKHESEILKLNYIPVGLGEKKFSNNFFNDKTEKNISHKNQYYGEYTFHYWLWKNYLDKIKTDWVGFCQYRKFFLNKKISVNTTEITFDKLNLYTLKDISNEQNDFDCILGELFPVDNFKFMKFAKKNFMKLLTNPSIIFDKSKRNIKLHFDIFHGDGNLDKAIELLEIDDRRGFRDYVNSKTSLHPHNMFVCKKIFLREYYNIIFPWLSRCEKIFGFDELKGYGMTRIYGFLAERFLSYWFSTNCKVKKLPILVKDLSDYRNL